MVQQQQEHRLGTAETWAKLSITKQSCIVVVGGCITYIFFLSLDLTKPNKNKQKYARHVRTWRVAAYLAYLKTAVFCFVFVFGFVLVFVFVFVFVIVTVIFFWLLVLVVMLYVYQGGAKKKIQEEGEGGGGN